MTWMETPDGNMGWKKVDHKQKGFAKSPEGKQHTNTNTARRPECQTAAAKKKEEEFWIPLGGLGFIKIRARAKIRVS